MKNNFFILTTILFAALIAHVSCKKDNNVDLNGKENALKTTYQPPKVDDMNIYLRDFKQKMQTRGTNETMDVEEAAWHLSSVANYDFGDVAENFARIHYDTLNYQINLNDGKVLLSDLSLLYNQVSADIESLFQSLNFENKHIRFIGSDITNNGDVVISIMITRDWVDHQWFFDDPFELVDVLDQYYSDELIYYMNDNFGTELKRVLDILTRQSTGTGRYYLLYSRTDSLRYYNYSDPYSSMNYYSSRIFADVGHPATMTMDEMYYYTDSYAGFSVSNALPNEVVISWYISELRHDPVHHYYNTYHVPAIKFGYLFQSDTLVPPVH